MSSSLRIGHENSEYYSQFLFTSCIFDEVMKTAHRRMTHGDRGGAGNLVERARRMIPNRRLHRRRAIDKGNQMKCYVRQMKSYVRTS